MTIYVDDVKLIGSNEEELDGLSGEMGRSISVNGHISSKFWRKTIWETVRQRLLL